MNIMDCVQGDSTWHKLRAGMMTSSKIAAAVKQRKKASPGKTLADELAVRTKLKYELLYEKISGQTSEHFVSKWMEIGSEMEPIARTEYEQETDSEVVLVGFVMHPTEAMFGCSPDGLIGKDGLAEFKVPRWETHMGYLLADAIPEDYQCQMQWQMGCTEEAREWNDFFSFCPAKGLPPEARRFLCRLNRNQKQIDEMEVKAKDLLAEVETLYAKVMSRHKGESMTESQLRQSVEKINREQARNSNVIPMQEPGRNRIRFAEEVIP